MEINSKDTLHLPLSSRAAFHGQRCELAVGNLFIRSFFLHIAVVGRENRSGFIIFELKLGVFVALIRAHTVTVNRDGLFALTAKRIAPALAPVLLVFIDLTGVLSGFFFATSKNRELDAGAGISILIGSVSHAN